ncbi:MAG: iron-sulfur cluster assembly accessory protein [Balneolaceae bacterium]|nr:iron-sulfur cluster assembly accessory protein [Balneolaceae bacterium]
MAVQDGDEQLDDVIADLIDEDGEEQDAAQQTASPFEGIDTSGGGDLEGPPVRLTSRAASQVRRIREKEDLDEGLYLRVAVEGGGCSGLSYKLGFDHKSEEDRILESEGVQIVVDPKHMMYLEGISIDYPDGLDSRGFTFDNPNANETCGCGTSFAT